MIFLCFIDHQPTLLTNECKHVCLFVCLFICHQLENVGDTLRESKRSAPTANELSSRSRPERSFVMETSHNGSETNNLTTMYNWACGKFKSGLCCVFVFVCADYWRSTWTVRGCCLRCLHCLTALTPTSLHLKPRPPNTITFMPMLRYRNTTGTYLDYSDSV